MKAILANTEGHVDPDKVPVDLNEQGRPDNTVKFWGLFILNLELRAGSFNERLENEISLVKPPLLLEFALTYPRHIISLTSCNWGKPVLS